MRSGAESARPQPALTLNHDELLLLEAVLCFQTRASTSADLRDRLADLWDRVSRVRIAASPRSVRVGATDVRGRGEDDFRSPGVVAGGR